MNGAIASDRHVNMPFVLNDNNNNNNNKPKKNATFFFHIANGWG